MSGDKIFRLIQAARKLRNAYLNGPRADETAAILEIVKLLS